MVFLIISIELYSRTFTGSDSEATTHKNITPPGAYTPADDNCKCLRVYGIRPHRNEKLASYITEPLSVST